MVGRGLLVRLEAQPGKDAGVEKLLQSALPFLRDEPATTAWFALRFGPSDYGIFAVFADDAARHAHLAGPVVKALMREDDVLFSLPPRLQKLDVLAEKRPVTPAAERPTKGLLLTFKAEPGHETEIEHVLLDAQAIVEQEPRTTAWFAFSLDGEYGIFDAFPDNAGRFAHLAGHVPTELASHALSLMAGVPEMTMVSIIAEKIAVQPEEEETAI